MCKYKRSLGLRKYTTFHKHTKSLHNISLHISQVWDVVVLRPKADKYAAEIASRERVGQSSKYILTYAHQCVWKGNIVYGRIYIYIRESNKHLIVRYSIVLHNLKYITIVVKKKKKNKKAYWILQINQYNILKKFIIILVNYKIFG